MKARLPLFLLLTSAGVIHAHESCCEKLKHLNQPEFIPDPDASPPETHDGQPRLIPNPDEVCPDGWDDDDDGPWEASSVVNPLFSWAPPFIPNPKYKPPPTLADKVKTEVAEAVPWVTLGVVITAALDLFQLPLGRLQERLSSTGALGGAGLGLLTPLCSCGSLPVARSFAEAGVPLGTVVAFLTATQSSGLDSAAVTWGLLGPLAAFSRLLGAVILAVATGLAVPRAAAGAAGHKMSTAAAAPKACVAEAQGHGAHAGGAALRRALVTALDTAEAVFPMVATGIVLSTCAVHALPVLYRPYEALSAGALGAVAPLLVRLLVLASALPLQLCEHTTVTLAAGLQKAGASPGLAFAFLIAAPATNLPSLLVLLRAPPQGVGGGVRAATVVRVALALSLTALWLSYMVDGLAAAGVDLLVKQEAEAGGAMLALPSWYVGMSRCLAYLLVCGAFGRALSTALNKESTEAADDCCATKMD